MMNKEKKKERLQTIILLSLLALIIIGFLLWNLGRFIKSYHVKVDQNTLDNVVKAIESTSINMKEEWDKASVDEYTLLFDGEEHYLHDIDVNTEFGKKMLDILNQTKKSDAITSFEDYEDTLNIGPKNKDIVLKYNKGREEMFVYVPNSEYSFGFNGMGNVNISIKIQYFEPIIKSVDD